MCLSGWTRNGEGVGVLEVSGWEGVPPNRRQFAVMCALRAMPWRTPASGGSHDNTTDRGYNCSVIPCHTCVSLAICGRTDDYTFQISAWTLRWISHLAGLCFLRWYRHKVFSLLIKLHSLTRRRKSILSGLLEEKLVEILCDFVFCNWIRVCLTILRRSYWTL